MNITATNGHNTNVIALARNLTSTAKELRVNPELTLAALARGDRREAIYQWNAATAGFRAEWKITLAQRLTVLIGKLA